MINTEQRPSVEKRILNLMREKPTAQILFSRTNSRECEWQGAHTGPSRVASLLSHSQRIPLPLSVVVQRYRLPTTGIHMGSVDFSEQPGRLARRL